MNEIIGHPFCGMPGAGINYTVTVRNKKWKLIPYSVCFGL